MTKPTAIALVLLFAARAALAAGPGDAELVGLWEARLPFAPPVRGPLVLAPREGALAADIAGFSVPVKVSGRSHAFELPDGKGAFRGKIAPSGREMTGFWIQPPPPASRMSYATPVTMTREGDHWRGEVDPLEPSSTLFLPVTRGEDGRLATYLRNPERNLGIFIPVKAVERDGERVSLVGKRRGSDEQVVLFAGTIDGGRMAIDFGNLAYDFARVRDESASPFYPRGRDPPRYRYAPPPARDDGWPVGTLEEAGISRPAIEAFVQRLIDAPQRSVNDSQIHSVLIARGGKLVLEEYFHGHSRDQPHDTRSAGKSLLAVLVGAAMHDGIRVSESTPVYRTMLGTLPPRIDPRKRAMTLGHLLTMTGGHFCDDNNPDAPGNEDTMQEQALERDWYRYILALPMDRTPGEKFTYCSVDAHLGGGVLAKVAREPLPELFDRLVARPLRMGTYHMLLAPTGEGYMAGGSYFLPRDFLKLAQLMLNGGEWHGRRILERDWVRKSSAPLRAANRFQDYGYLWNSTEYPYGDRKVRAFFAGGNGGQIFMGIPELDLAIGFTGGNYNDASLFIPQRKLVPESILPAVGPLLRTSS